MPSLRNFILKIVPRSTAQKMEDESRTWIMRCSQCGKETSIWELGGLRYKAAGSPLRRYQCPHCKSTVTSALIKCD